MGEMDNKYYGEKIVVACATRKDMVKFRHKVKAGEFFKSFIFGGLILGIVVNIVFLVREIVWSIA